jgi:hypothetical protein
MTGTVKTRDALSIQTDVSSYGLASHHARARRQNMIQKKNSEARHYQVNPYAKREIDGTCLEADELGVAAHSLAAVSRK